MKKHNLFGAILSGAMVTLTGAALAAGAQPGIGSGTGGSGAAGMMSQAATPGAEPNVTTPYRSGEPSAQTPAQNGPQNPAVKGRHDNNSSAPVSGANSFTMNQAKAQIEAKGYTHVTGLKKGKDGVWRGRATKDGNAGPVSVDYQGNVN